MGEAEKIQRRIEFKYVMYVYKLPGEQDNSPRSSLKKPDMWGWCCGVSHG